MNLCAARCGFIVQQVLRQIHNKIEEMCVNFDLLWTTGQQQINSKTRSKHTISLNVLTYLHQAVQQHTDRMTERAQT